MNRQAIRTLDAALGWLAFPIVPVVLAGFYHTTMGEFSRAYMLTDPRDWGWFEWLFLLGPLWGYGFVAGATLGVPDDPGRRGWHERRAVWVAVGPWAGFLLWAALTATFEALPDHVKAWFHLEGDTWTGLLIGWTFVVVLLATCAHAWLLPAVAALRRARGTIGLRRALRRGLLTALTFVGSLVGGFWALTAGWRSFFFDPRVVPVLLAALGLAALSGCGTVTYGDVRRQDLFRALLLAWVFGLALIWQWWGRPRGQPPGPSA